MKKFISRESQLGTRYIQHSIQKKFPFWNENMISHAIWFDIIYIYNSNRISCEYYLQLPAKKNISASFMKSQQKNNVGLFRDMLLNSEIC